MAESRNLHWRYSLENEFGQWFYELVPENEFGQWFYELVHVTFF